MAIGRTKRAASLVLLLTLAADPPSPATAQMLWDNEEWRYVNYARQGYRPYTGGVWSELRKPAFDELGNYLMQGVQVFRTEEARENDPLAGSLVDESVEYRINLNRLVIGHDSYGDRSSRLMVGDFIRTKFSALTLDLASLNGVRWDIDLNPTQVTLVSSRMDWPIFPSGRLLARTDRDNEAHRERRWSTYLLGGHVGRRFGALNLGFNYVNLHRTDSLVDWGDNNIRGVLPSAVNRPPAWIAVRVNDGSDEDEQGARVHEMRIKNPELAHVVADVTLHDTEVIDQSYPNGDQFFPQGRRIPPYVQFLKGEFPPAQRRAEGYHQADGTEYLIFWFQIPHELRDTISEVEFEALVSDDYDIELSEVFLPISRETSSNPSISGERATYYYSVAGSRGNVRDQSNLEWIEFSYGRQTGRTTASVRMEYERPGFELTAELAGTWDFRQHSSTAGRKAWQATRAQGWFVNFEKHLAGLVVRRRAVPHGPAVQHPGVGGGPRVLELLRRSQQPLRDPSLLSHRPQQHGRYGYRRRQRRQGPGSRLPLPSPLAGCQRASGPGSRPRRSNRRQPEWQTASPTTWSRSSSITPIPPSSYTATISTTTSSTTAKTTVRPTIRTTSIWRATTSSSISIRFVTCACVLGASAPRRSGAEAATT